jgi:hypothetical protein
VVRLGGGAAVEVGLRLVVVRGHAGVEDGGVITDEAEQR